MNDLQIKHLKNENKQMREIFVAIAALEPAEIEADPMMILDVADYVLDGRYPLQDAKEVVFQNR